MKIKRKFLIGEANYRGYTYDSHGKATTIKEYRNFDKDYILKTYNYDVFDRVTSMKYANSSNLDKVMESYSYTYDKNNNILSKTTVNNYPSKDSDKINETKEYTYDVDNRFSTCITTNGEKEVVNQENLYNGNSKRIQKKEGNNVVNYFYQDGVVFIYNR